MPSLIAMFVWTLSCLSVASSAVNVPREAQIIECQNPPYQHHPAGVMIEPHHGRREPKGELGPPLAPDPKATKILCAPGTMTFIKLTRRFQSDDLKADKNDPEIQSQLQKLVDKTWSSISQALTTVMRDGVISSDKDPSHRKALGWIFQRTSTHGSFRLQMKNAHHKAYVPHIHWGTVEIKGHEITWGVLNAALMALNTYMRDDEYGWTECSFEVWDGKNMVGVAEIVRTEDYDSF